MNQEEIVEAVADKFTLTKAETRKILKFVIEKITDDLKKGERVYIRNFGSLKKITEKEKRIKSIDSGKMITVPERETVEFEPAEDLEEKIRFGETE